MQAFKVTSVGRKKKNKIKKEEKTTTKNSKTAQNEFIDAVEVKF